MFIQETWLHDFQSSEITSLLRGSQCHAVSAMRDEDIGRAGRPHGGVAVVWRASLPLTCRPVVTTSSRLAVVTAEGQGRAMLWASVYMPVDGNSNESYEIYGDVLSELAGILSTYDNYEMIIGGDFNVSMDRPSRNLALFIQFMTQQSLNHVSLANVAYTFESATGSRSKIDYFLITDGLSIQGQSCTVLDDGCNLSNHVAIGFECNLPLLNAAEPNETISQTIIDWKAVTNVHIDNYKALLDIKMNSIDLNNHYYLRCNNLLCTTHKDEYLDLLNVLSDAMKECAWLALPRRRLGRSHHRAGWSELVSEHQERARFWHQVWVSADRPPTGQLADIRRSTRRKYHWAIKQLKKKEDMQVRNKTADSLRNKNFNDFWTTIKHLNKGNNHSVSLVDGVQGDSNIANQFKVIYEELYNSVADNAFLNTQGQIKHNVVTQCNAGKCSNTCHTITINDVVKGINCINSGKSDETYELNTNHIIHAPRKLLLILSLCFNGMLIHGSCNVKFYQSVIRPIPKNKKKSLNVSTNYRAISLNSVFSKLLDYIILDKIMSCIKSSDLQFAYKSEFSTTMCSFLVIETIQYYRSQGSNVYAVLLDASKAFDKVQYNKLFKLLIKRKVCSIILRLLMNMYLINSAVVRWNNATSSPFKVCNGVKQGGVLSPYLFTLYVQPLIDEVRESKLGCHVGHLTCNIFMYADDIILLSPTIYALKKLIII